MRQPAVVTIGVFDGVHRGHQALIAHARSTADQAAVRAVVVTFDPNPLEVLRSDAAPSRLTTVERRVELLSGLGVDGVEVLPFNADLAAMRAEDFATELLVGDLGAQAVVIGHGFRFGNRALGTAETLRAAGLSVTEVGLLGGEHPVSSTRIRSAIFNGDVAAAAAMLGRPAEVSGDVVPGQGRGRELGYPTANVGHHVRAAVPADGVYAGFTVLGNRRHPSAISVGSNPTFDGVSRTVESFLIDFDGDLYGRAVRIEFVQRLRAMVAFDGVAELMAQMALDVQQASAALRRMA